MENYGVGSRYTGVWLVVGIVLFGSFDFPSHAGERAVLRSPSVIQNGYALLYDLLGDEKDVAKLRIIKRERDELKNLVKEISQVSKEGHKKLETFAKRDPALNLKEQGLPSAEVEVRKAISKTKSKALLTDKGKEFEIQLLLSQNEALTYGAHLAGALAAAETNGERSQFLRGLEEQLMRLQQKVLSVLLAHYQWAE